MAESTPAAAADDQVGENFPMVANWVMSQIPQFDSVEDERQHRKERLAASFRLFAKFGFDEGVAGHITVRDPEHSDHFWVNPFALDFSLIKASDLVCCDHSGNVIIGDRPVNDAAFAIHSQVHQARPDVVAAAHSHSMHGKALAALHSPILPITQDSCAFYNDQALMDDFTGVVLDIEEGKKIAATLGGTKAIVLANHGLLTVGTSVEAAVWWFITMDRSANAQLLAMAAGEPKLIDDEAAAQTYGQVGSEVAGWVMAYPLFERIIKEQPDLLD